MSVVRGVNAHPFFLYSTLCRSFVHLFHFLYFLNLSPNLFLFFFFPTSFLLYLFLSFYTLLSTQDLLFCMLSWKKKKKWKKKTPIHSHASLYA